MSAHRLRPSLILERMIVNNLDSSLVAQVDDLACNKALFIRIFVCNLGIQYNNGTISLSLSEDDMPCDERTDLWLESSSCLEKLVA